MANETQRRRNIRFIETVIIPMPADANCVYCQDDILKGQEALQSPSTPGHFYHLNCFRDMVRSRGKDPDKFIKIINPDMPQKN